MMVTVAAGAIMVVMMRAALIVAADAKSDIAGQWISEVNVMMGMVDAVHQRDIRLARKHDCEGHADHGHAASDKLHSANAQPWLALKIAPTLTHRPTAAIMAGGDHVP